MRKKRIIPCILILEKRAVVTTQFKDPYYISDPFNLIRIYNEKEVDELMVVQIDDYYQKPADIDYLCSLAKICSSPLSIGGGVRNVSDIQKLIQSGAEKVILGGYSLKNETLIKEAIAQFGSSSLTINIDYVGTTNESRFCLANPAFSPKQMAHYLKSLGAGEIMFTSVDRNGLKQGFDMEWLDEVANEIQLPFIINGGGQSYANAQTMLSNSLVSAAALSTSLFIRDPYKAVLPIYA